MSVYIQTAEAISSQETFDNTDISFDIIHNNEAYFKCIAPDYKKYIEPALLRRMSKILKNGVASAVNCLNKAKISQPDAILVGTGLGCIDDTSKFLHQIIDNSESLLNPTPFINSTHNSISGQIALIINCKNYNLTFSQMSISFETALLEALMLFNEKAVNTVLLGGIDEINDETYKLIELSGCYDLKHTKLSEGSTFFVLSDENKNNNIEINDMLLLFKDLSNKGLYNKLNIFLNKNNIGFNDIDVVVSGANSYNDTTYNKFNSFFPNASIVNYKHLTGEYHTASAFGLFLTNYILSENIIPEKVLFKNSSKKNYKKALVCNYSKNNSFSFILLSK